MKRRTTKAHQRPRSAAGASTARARPGKERPIDATKVGFAAGTVMEIPLADGTYAYGVALRDINVRYHDHAWSEPQTDVERVLAPPVLFVLAGASEALRTRRWRKVGRVELSEEEARIPDTYIRQVTPPHRYFIVSGDGFTKRPASPEECEGLEECAVHRPEHVEKRLMEHFEKQRTAAT